MQTYILALLLAIGALPFHSAAIISDANHSVSTSTVAPDLYSTNKPHVFPHNHLKRRNTAHLPNTVNTSTSPTTPGHTDELVTLDSDALTRLADLADINEFAASITLVANIADLAELLASQIVNHSANLPANRAAASVSTSTSTSTANPTDPPAYNTGLLTARENPETPPTKPTCSLAPHTAPSQHHAGADADTDTCTCVCDHVQPCTTPAKTPPILFECVVGLVLLFGYTAWVLAVN
ncbi:hypothetical protein OPT61_g8589 [Boeremia exigua]|uniref:Uncharacterized protein n=1 Tax=Boeremia exigua TaxID=749465 RepID=A0ACC2HZA1_9PLEO|nr:hypothetical protein OPT61_g8589 [Boeremia exigua]